MNIDSDILILDDQISNLRLLTDLLEKEGYQVRPAENPQMAIDSAIQKTPGLILLNVGMPGMDGFEICRQLKQDKQTQHVPVIFISSLNDTKTRIRGFGAGCVDFILKPFNELEVLTRVKTQMHLHEMLQNMEKLIEQRTSELTKSKDLLEQNIKALKESEERLRMVFEYANETIVITQDEQIKYCNPQIMELFGYSTEEIHSMNFSGLIHLADLETVRREYQAKLSGEHPKNSYSVRIITKDGQEKFINISSTLVKWDGGPAALAMITDINQLKKTESDLRKSEERYRQLMEQSPWPTVILSPDGKIILVNSAWKKLWNLSDEEEAEVIAKYNILTDPQYEKLGLMEMVKKAFEGKHTILPPIQYDNSQTVDDFNLELLNDFKSLWIQLHLNSVKDEKGQIVYIVSTYNDLTDLKNAEQKVQEQRDLLARMSRANEMGHLTASITHELNQPLTGILSNAQAAELILKSKHWDLEEIKEIFTEIVSDTKRAGEVIRNLRELYRGQKVEFNPFDMNEIINDTVQLLHSELVMQHVEIKVKSNSSIPTMNGNNIQIQQVLVNLIMNSIQAMENNNRDDRIIEIQITHDDNVLTFYVTDTGTGIDPDKIDRIFEPLATWKPEGTGMGLAISNSIVESHGGRMWAENGPAGGALVGFALPLIKIDFNKNE